MTHLQMNIEGFERAKAAALAAGLSKIDTKAGLRDLVSWTRPEYVELKLSPFVSMYITPDSDIRHSNEPGHYLYLGGFFFPLS